MKFPPFYIISVVSLQIFMCIKLHLMYQYVTFFWDICRVNWRWTLYNLAVNPTFKGMFLFWLPRSKTFWYLSCSFLWVAGEDSKFKKKLFCAKLQKTGKMFYVWHVNWTQEKHKNVFMCYVVEIVYWTVWEQVLTYRCALYYHITCIYPVIHKCPIVRIITYLIFN